MITYTCVNGHTLHIVYSKKSPQPPFCLTCLSKWGATQTIIGGQQ